MSTTPEKSSKFGSDVMWNVACFGLIGVSGILLNILLVKFYDDTALGVFNQVYAVYLLLSQLAVGGIHLSVQYYTPLHSDSHKDTAAILQSALTGSFISSVVIIAAGYLCAPMIGYILDSPAVGTGIIYCVWGLLFFSWNKILIALLNGLRHMKAFAIFQLLRFIFILTALTILVYLKVSYVYSPLILAASEALLFILLVIYLAAYLRPQPLAHSRNFLLQHYRFGRKALIGNFLLDINTKVDIFILGLFQSDALVGVYSFAASIAEGFMLFPALLRNNINPVITLAFHRKNPLLLNRIITRMRKVFFRLTGTLALASLAAFPMVPLVFGFTEWKETWIVYAILISGIILTAGYQPLVLFFNQVGQPALQTWFIFLVFLSNVVFNLALVPFFSMYGSAAGTALSFLFQALLFIIWSKPYLKIRG